MTTVEGAAWKTALGLGAGAVAGLGLALVAVALGLVAMQWGGLMIVQSAGYPQATIQQVEGQAGAVLANCAAIGMLGAVVLAVGIVLTIAAWRFGAWRAIANAQALPRKG
jgi:hypothetical protein